MNRRLIGVLLAVLTLVWPAATWTAEVPAVDAESEAEAETEAEEADSAEEPQADDDDSGSSDPLQPASRWQAAGTGLVAVHPDRWQLLDGYGVQVPRGSLIDPYNQNPLKGDFPFRGSKTFLRLDGVLNPVIVDTNQDAVDTQINTDLVLAAEVFHGSTAQFKPKDWAFKVSGKGIFNRGNVDVDDFALLEAFGEVKIADLNSYYDFVAVRAGSQFFKSDFNGFIFQDFNLGAQFFGNLNADQSQYTAAYVSVQKQTPAGGTEFESQDQDVAFLNWFQEDVFIQGFDTVFSFHLNQDRQIDQQDLDVSYVGFATAGHLGRVVVAPTVYFAFGEDEDLSTNDVSAYFAGVEFEYPRNSVNFRAAAFTASGDDDPADDKDEGFDSIKDNINLFGGNASFVIGGANFGTRPNSFIPSFRSVATRSNFVNPGIILINGGVDVVITPTVFFESNVNYFAFVEGDGFNVGDIDGDGLDDTLLSDDIGVEVNAAVTWRVFLNENFVIKLAVNGFSPGDGGEFFLGNDDTVITTALNIVAVY
jgi:hypothetical protein